MQILLKNIFMMVFAFFKNQSACALPKYDQTIKSVSYNVIENNR
jgi:hypothetical protein